jgi:hypothetical protein
MSAILIALLWRRFSSSFTRGTLAQCRALTSHAAWLRLDAISIFRLTSPQESMRSCTPHLGPSSRIPNSSHLASPAAALLPNYWLKNSVAGTTIWSIHGGGKPRIYSVGDVIFARRATRSDSKRGQVNKLMHPFTGPWRIVTSLPWVSYELEFATNTARKSKKHASDLSP